MTKSEFNREFGRLISVFPLPKQIRLDTDMANANLPTAKQWAGTHYEFLKDIPVKQFRSVVDELIRDCRFFPRIMEIVERHRAKFPQKKIDLVALREEESAKRWDQHLKSAQHWLHGHPQEEALAANIYLEVEQWLPHFCKEFSQLRRGAYNHFLVKFYEEATGDCYDHTADQGETQ